MTKKTVKYAMGNEDLKIPATPHKLAKAVMKGGAERRKATKKSS